MTNESEATQSIMSSYRLAEKTTRQIWDLAASNIALELYLLKKDTGLETKGSWLASYHRIAVGMLNGEWVTKREAMQEQVRAMINELQLFGGNSQRTKDRIEQLNNRLGELNRD